MNIVVTTIFDPTLGINTIAERLGTSGGRLWLIGDCKGPFTCNLPNTEFWPIEKQRKLDFALAAGLPEKHYARKNLGYLLAIQAGAPFIVETDDDNIPEEEFWKPRHPEINAHLYRKKGWVNTYAHFSSMRIWPRGLPLDRIHSYQQSAAEPGAMVEAFIQQGLADENPDVDAIYRLVSDLPFRFENRIPLALGPGAWCPFNSQNTTFFKEAFPLLYLPSYCTFRMTDIWRSFVAQRCLWEMSSVVAFTSATVRQERNDHDLMLDFADEIPGYLKNADICAALQSLSLRSGRNASAVTENLTTCYAALVELEVFPEKETRLVENWCRDVLRLIQS